MKDLLTHNFEPLPPVTKTTISIGGCQWICYVDPLAKPDTITVLKDPEQFFAGRTIIESCQHCGKLPT